MVLAPLVIDLGVLLMFLVALALCLLAKPLVSALFQVASSAVGWIPWLGGKVTGDLHRIEQRVTHYLGSAVTKLEARIGVVYHSAARLVEEMGEKIAGAFELAFALAESIVLLATWKGVLALYHSLVGQEKATVSKVKEHTKAVHDTTKVAKAQAQAQAQVIVKVQAIPADVVVPRDLAGLRGQVREVEHELGRLWDRVRGLSPSIVGGIAVGAVTFALSRLRLGWLRCAKVDKVGRRLCGMDSNLLDSLLLDTIAIVGTVSLIEFIRDAQAIEAVALDALGGFIREFPKV